MGLYLILRAGLSLQPSKKDSRGSHSPVEERQEIISSQASTHLLGSWYRTGATCEWVRPHEHEHASEGVRELGVARSYLQLLENSELVGLYAGCELNREELTKDILHGFQRQEPE